MNVIFSHPTGNANVRAACYGFEKANILNEFNTTIASFSGDLLDYISKISAFSEFKRRRYESSLQPLTHLWPWRELGRLAASKAKLSSLLKHEVGLFSIDSVYKDLDRHVASKLDRLSKKGAEGIYSYEDSSLHSFQLAKELGLYCLYDLPIGYWRTARNLLQNELTIWPEWASTLTGFKDSPAKLARKDEELRLADHIFVASQFTAQSLSSYPGKLAPISIIPYGFPDIAKSRIYRNPAGRRLKLLFVGGLSQRKGIANLFAAMEGLERFVELTIVGKKTLRPCAALDKALSRHHWIPTLSHNDVLTLMREHDVLIFPSLFEGFGLVITEAMSQGTPVITTDRTAGPDLITQGQDGWLIEAGSTNAIRQVIEVLLHQPDQVVKAGQAAMETARLRPWSVYGQELANAVALIKRPTTATL